MTTEIEQIINGLGIPTIEEALKSPLEYELRYSPGMLGWTLNHESDNAMATMLSDDEAQRFITRAKSASQMSNCIGCLKNILKEETAELLAAIIANDKTTMDRFVDRIDSADAPNEEKSRARVALNWVLLFATDSELKAYHRKEVQP